MALKADRAGADYGDEVKFFMAGVGEKGSVVTFPAGATGAGGMDDSNAVVIVATGTGDIPVGILLTDVVSYDATKQPQNVWKAETNVGGKVRIMRKGWCRTNMLATGVTPTPGAKAYFNASGQVTTTGSSANAAVGRFRSGVDSDGYVEVYVDC